MLWVLMTSWYCSAFMTREVGRESTPQYISPSMRRHTQEADDHTLTYAFTGIKQDLANIGSALADV